MEQAGFVSSTVDGIASSSKKNWVHLKRAVESELHLQLYYLVQEFRKYIKVIACTVKLLYCQNVKFHFFLTEITRADRSFVYID